MGEMIGKPVVIRHLKKKYDAVEALASINLNINPGEFCTLLGASGSGKSTLLKCLAGFEQSDSGTILVDGKDIEPVSIAKRNIGMVFQNYALFPHMTVLENVAFGLEMRKFSKVEIARKVQSALALVELSDYQSRLPSALSGGQQQRVALARALVIEPDILLMDEPLGALDKNLRKSIQFQLKELHQKTGITVIYVTHDQEEALFLSDKIALMHRGKIEQFGTPEELYLSPSNSFVADFLGECNFIPHGEETLAVRPENIVLEPMLDDAAGYKFDATVKSLIFTGSNYRLLMDVDGTEVSAFCANNAVSVKPGESIRFGFEEQNVMELYAS